jgi:tetratricopeptide (TPR) repeat protein
MNPGSRNSDQNPDTSQADKPAASRKNWLLTIMGVVLTMFLILIIVLLTFKWATVYETAVVTVLVSFFPISYLAFEVRASQHKDRLVSRINLLGFADEREQERWENLYRQLNPAQEYILFVSLAALISLFGFGFLRFSPGDSQGLEMLDNFTAQTMFYSFLGAYVFSIYNVSRRYVTYDMAPGVYLQSTVLMITVIAIGYIVALYLQQNGDNSLVPPAVVPILAFLIGYIPESGIRLLSVISGRYLKLDNRRELNLGEVNGISIWHEARLREAGVDNVQNLAAMDIRQLLLTSRYSMPQVINWVDQAILLTTLPENTVQNLRKVGINTMTALIRLLAPVPHANPEQLKLAPTDANDELSHDEIMMLATLVSSNVESSPNLAYVIAYWQAIRQVETEQIRAQTENVLSDITRLVATPVFANDRTINLLTNLVSTSDFKLKDLTQIFAKDAASAVGLANAYIENAAYLEAIEILTNTIAQYRDRSEDLSPAYASRGLARGSLAIIQKAAGEEFTKLVDDSGYDFKAAIQVNPRYPVTYIYRGALLIQRKEYQDALVELDQAIELDPTIPKAYLTRGKAHSNLNQYELAISDFDQAIKLARARDLQRILEDAFFERATLYLNSSKFENAERDFNEEIFLDSQNPQAYLGRGKALLLRGSKTLDLSNNLSYPILFLFSRAINNFETAIVLYQRQQKQRHQDRPDPNIALAYSNIAQTYFQLEQYVDAVANVQRALDLGDQSIINFKVRGLSYKKIGELKLALGDLAYYQSKLPENSAEIPILQVITEQVQKKLNQTDSPKPLTDSPLPDSSAPS